jgi:hypothetical protein
MLHCRDDYRPVIFLWVTIFCIGISPMWNDSFTFESEVSGHFLPSADLIIGHFGTSTKVYFKSEVSSNHVLYHVTVYSWMLLLFCIDPCILTKVAICPWNSGWNIVFILSTHHCMMIWLKFFEFSDDNEWSNRLFCMMNLKKILKFSELFWESRVHLQL